MCLQASLLFYYGKRHSSRSIPLRQQKRFIIAFELRVSILHRQPSRVSRVEGAGCALTPSSAARISVPAVTAAVTAVAAGLGPEHTGGRRPSPSPSESGLVLCQRRHAAPHAKGAAYKARRLPGPSAPPSYLTDISTAVLTPCIDRRRLYNFATDVVLRIPCSFLSPTQNWMNQRR